MDAAESLPVPGLRRWARRTLARLAARLDPRLDHQAARRLNERLSAAADWDELNLWRRILARRPIL